ARAERHQSGGAVREGSALLQGIAICGHCGRGLFTYYRGKNATPGYRCSANELGTGGGHHCFDVGAVGIDKAVTDAFLDAITPAAVEASLLALEQLETDRDGALQQWRLEVERVRYEAERAERRYRACEPENRLVGRGLETEWENRLRDLAAAENELRRREQHHPRRLRPDEIELLTRLAKLYPDDVIAGILNRQGRKTATGQRFTAGHVGNLRRYHKMDRFQPPHGEVSEGELVTVQKAAQILGVVPSTLHRWLNAGFIVGEQITPGAPWRIRLTEELRARF